MENKNSCKCLKESNRDGYWGHWLGCECGYNKNVEGAKYCGGCGKKISVVDVIEILRNSNQYDEDNDSYWYNSL